MNFTSDSEPPTEIQLGFSFPEPSPLIHDTSITFRLESPYKAPIPPTSSTVEEEHSEQLRRDLDRFYKENKQKIENSLDVGSQEKESKGADVDSAIDVFLQTASVVLEGLTALGNIHPVIGVAIFAFQGVIKLDLARRDNDKKVLAVILQMQNMMSALFQLRELRGVHLHETSKDQEKGALQRLIEVVAQNITSCRSDLAYYTKRKFISKLISAKNYEQLFADHIQIFVLRRSELQTAIATYTALGVDAANMAIIEVGNKLESMDKKFETMILAIFRKLDTPRERDIFKFLDKNGGAQKCVDNDELLRKLLSDSGESLATGKTGQDDFATLQTSLKDELSADLKQILEKNQARFERLLNVQNNNMKRISDQMEDQGQVMYDHTTKLGEILNKVTTVMVYEEGRFRKKEVKLKDPEIQQVWERMGLDRRSVKATHFVLTFRDHILMGYSTPSTPQPRRPTDLNDDQPSVLLFSTAPAPSSDKVLLPAQEDPETETNQWMLEYIDAAYVQPIIEAIDDDGSGFISVQEASKFALARPKELSLLHWMAYWAAGWHINITNYRWNIYSVLLEMHDALPSIHLANRSYIDEYLSEIPFRRVEAVLRSIRPLPDSADKESKLSEMANSIANAELQRLLANLNEMSFILESSLDVNAVGGTERVETWILPLLYLVLKHHLAIMKLAQKLVLDPVELSTHTTSLRSIFLVFDDRMHNLEAKFRQVHRDVDARFESFAYGMFFTSFKKKEYAPSENTTMTSRERQYLCHPLAISEAEEITDSSILAKPPGENFEFDEGEVNKISVPSERDLHPIEGLWTCTSFEENNGARTYFAPIILNIGSIVDSKIEGKGENYLAQVEIVGNINSSSSDGRIDLEFKIWSSSKSYRSMECKGQYIPEQEIIQGHWTDPEDPKPEDVVADNANNDGSEETDEEDVGSWDDETASQEIPDAEQRSYGAFYIRRTPPDVIRFRHLLDGPGPDSEPSWNSWTVARKRWAFASAAILYRTRDRMGSSRFFRERIAERRKWTELSVRFDLADRMSYYSFHRSFSDAAYAEWVALIQNVHPRNARIFQSLSNYWCQRNIYQMCGNVCDTCRRIITFTRFQCVTCMRDDMNNQVDLCADCVDKPTVSKFSLNNDFAHKLSHSLIRSTRFMHKYELAYVIPNERLWSERLKKRFKAVEMKSKPVTERGNRILKGIDDNYTSEVPSEAPPRCACCDEEVTLPCYVCVLCSLFFICLDCDCDRRPLMKENPSFRTHTYNHPFLRIHDSDEVRPIKSEYDQLERQLEDMETRLNQEIMEGLSSLQKEIISQWKRPGITKNGAQKSMKGSEMKDDEVNSLVIDHGVKEVAETFSDIDSDISEEPGSAAEVDANATERLASKDEGMTAVKSRLEEGLKALELKVEEIGKRGQNMSQEDRISALEAKVDERLNALEARVENQFGVMLSLLQELVATTRPLTIGTEA